MEDDPDQREIYSSLLYYNGYDVSEAESMMGAVDAIEEHIPDVILLDIMLPDVNGLDAVPMLRSVPVTADIPIICMTSYDIEPSRAISVGCAAFLQKPIDGADLVRAIESSVPHK